MSKCKLGSSKVILLEHHGVSKAKHTFTTRVNNEDSPASKSGVLLFSWHGAEVGMEQPS